MKTALVYILLFILAWPVQRVVATEPCQQLVAARTCQSLLPILETHKAHYPVLQQVLAAPDVYQVQILYTRIERIERLPKLDYYYYQLNDHKYFYPASTVKLPLAALALQWLNEQQVPHLNEDTILLTDASRPPQTAVLADPTSQTGFPSVSHYIKKILLVSDNDASNRLYELLGQTYINEQLKQKGLFNTVINHRLSVPFSDEQNRYFNPVRFIDNSGKEILSLPERQIAQSYANSQKPELGLAYIKSGELQTTPMTFIYKNRQALSDFDGVIKRIVLPEIFPVSQQFNLTAQQRELLLQYMQMRPRHSASPEYSEQHYPDNYVKYFLYGGDEQRIPDHIRYYNKNGQAFGHVIDGAYIEDTKQNVAFFLSATIYTNANQILNDDTYETETIGKPFMRELGQLLYQFELKQRKAEH